MARPRAQRWHMSRFGDTLPGMLSDAWTLLARDALVDAVLLAQRAVGGPVTACEARTCAIRSGRQLARNARAFGDLADRIAALGPDEQGRTLHYAGEDSVGRRLWWVKEPEKAEATG